MTKEKLKNYDTLVFVSPNWQAGELSDEWKNAVILLKKSDLKSKKIALVGYDESLNICPAKTFRDKLKGVQNISTNALLPVKNMPEWL